mmetsp:Transcript_24548/g.39374  ORF Transcript_24548/g.39374 Transcript_24548/m.39374 type:complete len:1004 (-) Transcript_24548:64-3075(-)
MEECHDEAQEQKELSLGFTLTRSDDDSYKRHFALHPGKDPEETILIGRAAESDVQVSLVGVSSSHCELVWIKKKESESEDKKNRRRGYQLCVRDLSVNGTGLKLPDGTKVILKKGIDQFIPDGSSLLLPMKVSKAARGMQEVPRAWLTVLLDAPTPNGASSGKQGKKRSAKNDDASQDKHAAAVTKKTKEAAVAKKDTKMAAKEKEKEKKKAATEQARKEVAVVPEASGAEAKPVDAPRISSLTKEALSAHEASINIAASLPMVSQNASAPIMASTTIAAPVVIPVPKTPPGAPPPPEPGTRWTVWIDRSLGGKLGISINVTTLLIEKIAPDGLVAASNVTNPSSAVQAGDYIVDVNGHDRPDPAIAECKKEQMLKFTFLREADVKLSKIPPGLQVNIAPAQLPERPVAMQVEQPKPIPKTPPLLPAVRPVAPVQMPLPAPAPTTLTPLLDVAPTPTPLAQPPPLLEMGPVAAQPSPSISAPLPPDAPLVNAADLAGPTSDAGASARLLTARAILAAAQSAAAMEPEIPTSVKLTSIPPQMHQQSPQQLGPPLTPPLQQQAMHSSISMGPALTQHTFPTPHTATPQLPVMSQPLQGVQQAPMLLGQTLLAPPPQLSQPPPQMAPPLETAHGNASMASLMMKATTSKAANKRAPMTPMPGTMPAIAPLRPPLSSKPPPPPHQVEAMLPPPPFPQVSLGSNVLRPPPPKAHTTAHWLVAPKTPPDAPPMVAYPELPKPPLPPPRRQSLPLPQPKSPDRNPPSSDPLLDEFFRDRPGVAKRPPQTPPAKPFMPPSVMTMAPIIPPTLFTPMPAAASVSSREPDSGNKRSDAADPEAGRRAAAQKALSAVLPGDLSPSSSPTRTPPGSDRDRSPRRAGGEDRDSRSSGRRRRRSRRRSRSRSRRRRRKQSRSRERRKEDEGRGEARIAKASRPTATKSAPAGPTARKAAAKKSMPAAKPASGHGDAFPKLPNPPLTLPSQVMGATSHWPQGSWQQESTPSRVDPADY